MESTERVSILAGQDTAALLRFLRAKVPAPAFDAAQAATISQTDLSSDDSFAALAVVSVQSDLVRRFLELVREWMKDNVRSYPVHVILDTGAADAELARLIASLTASCPDLTIESREWRAGRLQARTH